jgi:hypothetical protein
MLASVGVQWPESNSGARLEHEPEHTPMNAAVGVGPAKRSRVRARAYDPGMRSGGRRRERKPVDYAEIRDGIKDGDIVLFRGKSWVSRAIRWVTGSPYSHSGVVAWWHSHLIVLEAVPRGISAARLSIVVHEYDGNCELWTTDGALERAEVIRAARNLLGRSYSKRKLLANLRRMALGRFGGDDVDPDDLPASLVCSEFVSRVWRAGGLDLKDGVSDRFTKPSDIARSPALRRVGDLCRPETARRALESRAALVLPDLPDEPGPGG